MAQITSDNVQLTSTDPSGATFATDYGGDNVGHWQEVKINVGGDGVDSILTNTAPLPIAYTNAPSQTFVPCAGNTSGTLAVPIEICGGASLSIAGVTLHGGTVDKIVGGTLDYISTVKGFGVGATVCVASNGLLGITAQITGDVKLAASTNNIGDVDVLTVAIPSYGFTSGGVTIDQTSDLARTTLPAGTFTTGFRVTNLGPSDVYIGATAATSLTAGSGALAHGFPLLKFGTIFIEASKPEGLRVVIDGTGTADIRICGS